MSLSTRLTVAMVALVLLTAAAVSILSYRNLEEAILPRALERVDTHTRLLASELESYARGARADIVGFRSAVAVEGIVRARLAGGIDPLDGTSEMVWRERMAARYLAELNSKPAYDQFRVIDRDGFELVRVDRSGPERAARVVSSAELQSKADREFFQQAITGPANEVYISSIDLNQNRGAIVTPYVPTLRVASRISAPDGKPFGVVVINVDMRPIFDRLSSLARAGGRFFVVNERGDYLVHPDVSKTFGFEFGRVSRWQDDFPVFAKAVGSSREAIQIIPDEAGERGAAALITVNPAGGPPVSVIQMVPNALIMAPAASLRESTFLAAAVAALLATVLAVLLARSLTRPLVQMTRAAEGFSTDRPIVVPAEAGGEIGVLARAFSRMATEVSEKTAALGREIAQRRRIFDTSLDLILVVDRKGTFVQVSPSSNAVLGRSPESMVGHSAIEFIHPDDLESTRTQMRAARRGKDMRNFECRYIHSNGSDVLLQWTGVWSEAEQQHYFIGRDVTARKAAAAALQQYAEREQREAEERRKLFEILSNTIASMVDAVLVADVDGRIIHSNPAADRLIGLGSNLTPAEQQEPDPVFRPDGTLIPRDQRPLRCAIRGEPVRNVEFTIKRKAQGKTYHLVANGAPLRDSASRITGAVVVYRDVTETKETERQLRQAQKMEAVGELTGGVAHDFNNILTVITGTIEILQEAVADKPDLAAVAKMIDDAASRGADLTQRLLAFARRQPLQPRETDINTLVIDAAKLLRPTLGEQIEIESMLKDDLPMALVDPSQLTSALINLALNSRDAMPNGGKLTVETKTAYLDEAYARANTEVQPGDYVMLAVSDTGSGIPAVIQDKVFDPFFTTKEVGRGTGLGLSMVYGFVKQSNGHIKIYSEEGHGTTIKLYLPYSEGHQAPSDAAPIAPVEGGSEIVLAVEDDALVRAYVVAQLRSLGYQVLTAPNAAEALVIIESDIRVDVLFTDVIMPGAMNGRQLAEAATKQRPGLKVLFTSGYTENAIVHHGRLDPGVLLLAKPYRKADLARMMRQAIAQGGPGVS